MKRPENLNKRYGWCSKHGVYLDKEDGCYTCKRESERKKDGECCAKLYYGPGHQSTTYCQVKGKHEKYKGKIVHRAQYGNYDATMYWHGREACTGHFDEPKDLRDD